MSAVVTLAETTRVWRVPTTTLLRIAVFAAILTLWQVVPSENIEFLISRPALVFGRIGEWLASGLLLRESVATLSAVVFGLLLGAATGSAAGLVAGMWRGLGDLIEPLFTALFALPKSAFIPLFILWFGISAKQHTIFVATVVFFFFFFSMFNGARATPRAWTDMLSIIGASRWQLVTKLFMPASFAWFLTAMRLAIPHAFVAAISIEVIASRNGLGHLVKTSSAVLDATGTVASIAWLICLSTAIGAGAIALAQTSRWHR